MKNIGYFDSPIGFIEYTYEFNKLYNMQINDKLQRPLKDYQKNSWINKQLDAYFKNELTEFKIEVGFSSYTPFQQEVFQALLNIPYGQTRSYEEIAKTIGRPKAFRAVGQACKKNPIGIVIPCHRVIGKDHSLTGYSGKEYIHIKEKLLNIEKNL
ncbi:methylated-DNA--[protein]-cysteine S-methyltransferase [Mariniplasma anaerobium]|uniref:methylated-DNA--[protein]-cysteine S-methyltransferase n=1 Tax=Mariniplasma anaerobium TaxID=2735436 RepID=A0A7U9TIZ5_9MOLU|nr:methylated-DNA--[protein]-cysteine S-methyltransferase [Mariniplasma anaerobium]BCR36252.1 methylated-DNA--protein-cysteine methyltransferase [Mariniplasma anaerobium]